MLVSLVYDGSGRPWQQEALAAWCRHLQQHITGLRWQIAGLPAAGELSMPRLQQPVPRSWWGRWQYQQRLQQQLRQQPPHLVLRVGTGTLPKGWQGPLARLYHPDWSACGVLPGGRHSTVLAGYHWQCSPPPADTVATLGAAPLPGAAQASWQQKEHIKQTYSDDCEYWLALPGEQADDCFQLLKAFSQLKKRQQTSMRLLILFEKQAPADWRQKLSTYKYRHDVQVHEQAPLQLLLAVLPGAYALLLHPSLAHGWLLASALAAAVPMATPDTATSTELLSGAHYRLQQWNEASLAAAMGLLYRDEHYRNTLVHTGSTLVAAMPLARQQQALYQWLQQLAGPLPEQPAR